MASRINKEIKANFPKYETLLKGKKNSTDKVITLNKVKKQHQNTLISSTGAKHIDTDEKLELIVESKIEDKRSFKFKLKAPDFSGEPFFRFDSDGASHFNRNPSIPLHEQKIDTPHFNAFNNQGKGIAYRTTALNTPNECEALLNDASLCMAHYCDEANIYYNNTEYIEINQSPSGKFDFNLDNLNPTDGVNYE